MKDVEFRFADSDKIEPIQQLLTESGLPHEDIGNHLHNFIIANSSKVIGVIGLEVYRKVGLLRSLAVKSAYQGKGIGKALYTRILAHAHLRGVKVLYLLTTSAERFFTKLGFSKVARDNVPEAIKSTQEFQGLCPSTAVSMIKEVENDAHYFPRDVLILQPDVPGARMWGIILEKTMFTYFEV